MIGWKLSALFYCFVSFHVIVVVNMALTTSLKTKYNNRNLFCLNRIITTFEAAPVPTVMADVAARYSLIIFCLELTHSDGIKDTLAVERLPCGLMPAMKLCELPFLQRGVQNLAWQPHGAIAWRLTWGQKQGSERWQTRPRKMNPLTVI